MKAKFANSTVEARRSKRAEDFFPHEPDAVGLQG